MKIVALIPARGGSKRIARKNLQKINGVSLTALAVRQAFATSLFDGVYVSTDDPDIVSVAVAEGAGICLRPPELAGDDTPMIDVVRHFRNTGNIGHKLDFEWIVLLQPTSPFREPDDIKATFYLARDAGAYAAISVVKIDAHPVFLSDAGTGRLIRLRGGESVVRPNGAVYVLKATALSLGRDWWSVERPYAYVMPRERSLDIDTPEDLRMARSLAESMEIIA